MKWMIETLWDLCSAKIKKQYKQYEVQCQPISSRIEESRAGRDTACILSRSIVKIRFVVVGEVPLNYEIKHLRDVRSQEMKP